MTDPRAVKDLTPIELEAERLTELKVSQIAKICHEVNRGLCLGLGDTSQVAWEDADEEIRQSAISGVVAIMMHEVQRPEDSHVAWFTFKMRAGWKYGPVKDAEKKEHPCLVAFEKLPPEQQLKDYLFFNCVTVLAFR